MPSRPRSQLNAGITTITSCWSRHSLNEINCALLCSQAPLGSLSIPPDCSCVMVTKYASGLAGRSRMPLKSTLLCPFQMHGGSHSNTLWSILCIRSGRKPLHALNRATPYARGRFRNLSPMSTPVVL